MTLQESFIEAVRALFKEYRGSFGMEESSEEQCTFEQKFTELECKLLGHDIGPDQCGIPEHDYCYRCHQLKVDIND
jgi:hypothetical protein